MAFGKRFAPPSPVNLNPAEMSNLAVDLSDDFEVYTGLPWSGSDYVACNYAVGHLKEYLWSALSPTDREPNPETLFCAIGAIAGIVNQKHVFLKLRETGYMIAPPAIDTINVKNGLTLYKGDTLAVGLIDDPRNKQDGLEYWPIILGAGLAAGVDLDSQPTTESMERHVAEQCDQRVVNLRVGMHQQPLFQPHELVKLVWPIAKRCFEGQINPGDNFGRVNLIYQTAICAYVTQQYIEMMQGRFPIGVALTIAMESALYTSMLQPSYLEVS